MTRHKTRARNSGRRTRKQSGGMFGWISGLFGPKPAPVPGQVATPAVDADPNNKPEEKPGFWGKIFGSKKTPLPGPPPPGSPPAVQGGGSRKKSKKHRHHRK